MFVEIGIILGALLVAYAGARLAVPAVLRLPLHERLLDRPDGGRRLHARAVPRLGGIAVFAGVLFAVTAASLLRELVSSGASFPPLTAALVGASGILFLIGLADDLHGVHPLVKLGGQTIAALIVCQAGFSIQSISLPPFSDVALGWLGVPITSF